MSDERDRTDNGITGEAFRVTPGGFSSEPGSSVPPQASYSAVGNVSGSFSAETPGAAGQPVAFCQDCGRVLTPENLRTVGRAIFCEPCLERRVGNVAGAGATSAAGNFSAAGNSAGAPSAGGSFSAGTDPVSGEPHPGGYAAVPGPLPAAPGEPRPVLAAILGLIPGVGAMYNGQFAKGVAHLVIFAILVSLADNVNGIFGLFVAGWIAYQAFEAYHTAVARRDFLPLPNAFGLNDIGERMGFGVHRGAAPAAANRNWTPAAAQPRPTPAQPGAASAQPASSQPGGAWPQPGVNAPASPGAGWGPAPVPPVSRDWVGYVPPTAFAQAGTRFPAGAPASYPQPPTQAAPGPGYAPPYASPGYAETFSGGMPTSAAANGFTAAPGPPAASRFPSGALWLIGLGLLILLANMLPDWRISERWMPPVLFAGLSVWLLTRRLHTGARLACIIRWPALLMVLAVLFALHALYFAVTFGTMCAVLLIALGALLVIERTLGAGDPLSAQGTGPTGGGSFIPSASFVPPSTDPTSFTTAGPAAAAAGPAAAGGAVVADDVAEGR